MNEKPNDPIDETSKEERGPEDVDEDQLDEAIEETFPASDPISP